MNGHWYTDKQGNHYFVEDGQSPKEGWEASKRRKMINGGKYQVSEDGNEYKDVSRDEYDKFEADSDFDLTNDDDFGFDEDDEYMHEELDRETEEQYTKEEDEDYIRAQHILHDPDEYTTEEVEWAEHIDSMYGDKRSPELKKEIHKDTKDEREAIEGYDKTLEHVKDENTREQIEKIKDEEIAHEEYLKEAKHNPNAKYEDPDEKLMSEKSIRDAVIDDTLKDTNVNKDAIKTLADKEYENESDKIWNEYKEKGKNTWNQKLQKGDKVKIKDRDGNDMEAYIGGFYMKGKVVDDDTYEEGKDNMWHDFRGVQLVDENGKEVGNINANQILEHSRKESSDEGGRIEDLVDRELKKEGWSDEKIKGLKKEDYDYWADVFEKMGRIKIDRNEGPHSVKDMVK